MRTGKRITRYIFISTLVLSLQSCLKDEFELIQSGTEPETQSGNYTGFEFKTTKEYDVSVRTYNNLYHQIDGIYTHYSNVSFNTSPGNVSSVTGQLNTEGYLNLAANETEEGQSNAVADFGAGEYYVSDIYLPWAINLPASFDYPAEKQDILLTHLMFNSWATSMGYNYMDWYQDKPDYRDKSRIYSK